MSAAETTVQTPAATASSTRSSTASSTESKDPGPQEIVFLGQEPEEISTPVEKPAEEAKPAAVEGESTEVTEEEQAEDPAKEGQPRDTKGRFKPGVQERIDELTKSRRDAEREAAYWKARATGTDSAQTPAQAATPKPPVREDFQSDEEFEDAKIDYKVEQRLATREAQNKQMTEIEVRTQEWNTKKADVRSAVPDFDQVMSAADLPVAPHVAELLFEHEQGPLLTYHFAKNPEKLALINNMGIAKAAMALAKFHSEISKPAAPAAKLSPVAKVSEAPRPIETVGSGRSTQPALDQMSMEDYVKTRRAQMER